MAVYQAGRDEIPDALLRFRRAVGNRGNITGPYRDRLFHWTTKKHRAFDEVMTMLWPWLSESKRAQLRRATETSGRPMPPDCPQQMRPESTLTTELAWVAGFFDGEGYIGSGGANGRRTIEMSIAQATPAGSMPPTLARVRSVLGVGSLRGPRLLPNPWSKLPQCVWVTNAFEDVQFATAMLWRWLGPVKRTQARDALQRYLARERAA
ncbi:MAG TPA: hypothetical protein VGS01_05095 [Candidatus Limnocylindria bacterium]|jgi:hypothetical protein|nr:hypothetical protein [Candidatus Limnocylindria bacterium]